MQQSSFERLLKLAQRTGDRLIVTDPTGKDPVVILSLAEYESLLDFDSFRTLGKGRDNQAKAHGHVQKSEASAIVSSMEVEGEFDPEALEEQVMAAMEMDEPEVVPVSSPALETQGIPEVSPEEAVQEPLKKEAERRPISRKTPTDDGEERFYLEPV